MWSQNQDIAKKAAALLKAGFVVLDLETTSLAEDPRVGIVEVGILDPQGEAVYHTLVKPGRQISPGALAVHGISNYDVAGSPDFTNIYPRLAEHLKGQRVVAYNVKFEQAVLQSVCRQYNQPPLEPAEWHCAMKMYAAFHYSRRYSRLEIACRAERIPIGNAHRALDDCRLTLALVRKMAEAAKAPDA